MPDCSNQKDKEDRTGPSGSLGGEPESLGLDRYGHQNHQALLGVLEAKARFIGVIRIDHGPLDRGNLDNLWTYCGMMIPL